jgi:hypothetical protein
MPFEPLTSFTWPTGGVPLAGLTIRLDDLAARLGVPVVAWDEDGLGPARGFGGRLPSGRVCFLEELELAVRHQGVRGPTVYADASDLGALGAEPLVAEVLGVLGLSRSDLAGVVGPEAQRAVTGWVRQMTDAKADRSE